MSVFRIPIWCRFEGSSFPSAKELEEEWTGEEEADPEEEEEEDDDSGFDPDALASRRPRLAEGQERRGQEKKSTDSNNKVS